MGALRRYLRLTNSTEYGLVAAGISIAIIILVLATFKH
jgi:Flp pilus assembly pilin Flp